MSPGFWKVPKEEFNVNGGYYPLLFILIFGNQEIVPTPPYDSSSAVPPGPKVTSGACGVPTPTAEEKSRGVGDFL